MRTCQAAARFESAYYARGIAWYRKRDYDKAIADFNRALKIDPKDSGAYDRRANAWDDLGQPDKAIADYNLGLLSA